jgi:hypothetical protein
MKNLLSIICLSLPLIANAEIRFKCPEWYPTSFLTVNGVPEEWKGINNIAVPKLGLTSAGIVAGPPTQYPQGIQIGESARTEKGFKQTFEDLDKFTESPELWVYCGYGSDNTFQLLKKLPKGIKRCITHYTKTKHGDYNISVVCH